ncbi:MULTISPECIES: alpha-L-rhamnosidase C-terminal domain-containing protein [Acidobacterium]|uniref:Alfa-L-rhamnosidase homolog n=1 Tax=Acidobacterium capsulatum (strain ATCC 51196 / DSM 11244 / BCRC 80197 / JCM 7670 / NBRC 15755 / NCIMB 13165 / 161) TaxID=240015 RepID=C1F2B1_ACIC5|nr:MULTISPECIES: alpha-L-rhamnosidase C-terminal domain-containing protein [Acidobacterium]ACO31354.1 alfa-L-rhamnosidase homolog [Acidobacterium capsulatum ATCC 51196]
MAVAQMGNPANGPTKIPDADLDPARNLAQSQLESALHQPLPEHYIWTKADVLPGRENLATPASRMGGEDLGPHYFRRAFNVGSLPEHATLYVAGPREARIYVNGKKVGEFALNLDIPIGIRVYACDVTGALRSGKNVVAIEAERGPDATNQNEDWISRQQSFGRVLAAMIVPAARGVQAPPLVMSDGRWKATLQAQPKDWEMPEFDDSGWSAVNDLGGIESSIDLFQGNADAGMYAWPGYDGISPFLAHYNLRAVKVSHVYRGVGKIDGAQSLGGNATNTALTVTLPTQEVPLQDAPQLLLDFGREVTGRIELQSASDSPAQVVVQYGESEEEAIKQPYLGADPIYLPPHGTAFGPKSAFRYAVVRFTGGRETRFRSIRLDGIAYPVKYQGSFESSDAELNKMWAIGAYTAHLCMQDDIWDAPKRDRRRWIGDLDVSGRTIDDVFGDHFLMEDTLSRLIGAAPVEQHVNEIPGYSAFWITAETEYYLHFGSMKQLESVHSRMVQLLDYMAKDLNQQNLFSDLSHAWPFVDWSPGMNGYDAQTRMATQFEYYAAFKDGAYLLHILHDKNNASRMEAKAHALMAAAQHSMLDAQGSFGSRWQPNAYAVLSGVAGKDQYAAIWKNALADVGREEYHPYIITPYYNFYVVSAMAKMGHPDVALRWIRKYWGGMVQEGATSYWEGYDPTWYKGMDFHESLQADNMSGFAVSLAHGWSSGVTPWLMAQMLGIEPTAGGFSKVSIRPDLMGLKWARGSEPTPHGLLKVSIRNSDGYVTAIDLPAGVEAQVAVPVGTNGAGLKVNGKPMPSIAAGGGRRMVELRGEGHYVVTGAS